MTMFAPLPASAAEGMIVRASAHPVAATLDRLEAAVKARGFVVFARLDHAAAAAAAGLAMPPTTVLVFGNPRAGTPFFLQQPTLAIDLPLRALVWQDSGGKVWLGYSSAAWLFGTVYPRHGLTVDAAATAAAEAAFAAIAEEATR